MPLLDARFFVTAVLTQREAGGNLSEVLDNLASVIRERFKVKRQVRVITAHGRITGWVLALLPPCLGVVLTLLAPEHMSLLWTDPLGIKMIVGALILQVVGTLIIRKLVDIGVPEHAQDPLDAARWSLVFVAVAVLTRAGGLRRAGPHVRPSGAGCARWRRPPAPRTIGLAR